MLIDSLKLTSIALSLVLGNCLALPSQAQAPSAMASEAVTIKASQRTNSVLVFNDNNQVVEGNLCNLNDALLKGAPGTVVSLESGQVVLARGKIVVDSGSMPVIVKVANLEAYIEPETLAVMTYEPQVGLAVRAYASTGASCVEVTKSGKAVNHNSGKSVSLNPGESLVATANLNDTENACFDKAGDLEQIALMSDLRFHSKNKNLYSRLGSHMQLIQVSTKQAIYDLRKKRVICARKPMRVLAASGSEMLIDKQGNISLPLGWITVINDTKCSIGFDASKVTLSKPAIVNVQALSGSLRIGTCHGINCVTVNLPSGNVTLNPGQELLVIDHVPQNSEVLGQDGVMRRCFTVHYLDPDKVAVAGDFSIISLVHSAEHLKPFRSAKCSNDDEMRAKLLKTSVAVQYATTGRGQYLQPQSAIENHKLSSL